MSMAANYEQEIQMLIRFFNMQTSCSFKVSVERNKEAMKKCLEMGNAYEVKNFIREYAETHEKGSNDIIECCEMFCERKISENREAEDAKAAADKSAEAAMPAAHNVQQSLDLLTNVVTTMVAQMKSDEIKADVMANVKTAVRDFIKAEYGHIERKIELQLPERKVELEGVQHEKFETVLKFVAANEPVFLTGPAGSGKNVLCQQVAKALGLDFYFSNAVTQEYKITGFTDANGVFHESQFYKAFKNGGLFMLDEMDASIPEVLIILNAAIANRYFDFPAPIGYVEAHPDFRVIAAGNTFGHGADYEYVGRNQLDIASLDRFAMVRVSYSEQIEMNVANQDEELVKFAHAFRNAAGRAGIRTLISYRAIGRIAKMQNIIGLEETMLTCLVKSMEKDDANIILKDLNTSNKYAAAFAKVVRNM